jgi:phosphate-selective porin OprO/OprP
MKRLLSLATLVALISISSWAQSTNDILNLLIENKQITSEQADSLRAEAGIKQQDDIAKQKIFPVSASRKIKLAGYGQIRYQVNEINANPDSKTGVSKSDGYDIRRAYLDLQGDLSPYWSYRMQVDFATSSPKLIDLYTDVKLFDYLNFTIGQQLVPFSIDNLTSNTKGDFIERSQVVDAVVLRGTDLVGNQNGRDIGWVASGSLLKLNGKYLFDYRAGIFNGQAINTADNNENKDFIGRIVLHPIAGLDLGVSYIKGKGNAKLGTATLPSNFDRQRIGYELNYVLKQFSLRGEYISSEDDVLKRNGYYIQTGYYILPQALQAVARYDVYDKDADVADNITTNYTLGLNYAFNSFVRLQGSYTFREEEGTKINNNLTALQLQLVF